MGCTEKLANEWHVRDPKTPEEVTKYYQENWKWYIGDLAWWHYAVEGRREWFYRHVAVFKAAGVKRILDYACGIASDSIFLADAGFKVTAVDFPGAALEFGKWRAKKYALDIDFQELPEPKLRSHYGAVLLLDVLEHIPFYWLTLEQLADKARVLCMSAPFADDNNEDIWHPQHLHEIANHKVNDILTKRGFSPIEGLYWVKV